jgi:asparagine synthase (glutamine-hydrolysing)
MCGIIGVFELKQSFAELRPQILVMSKKIRHRGPDWSGIYCSENAILAHERLAIVDPVSGAQPLMSEDGNLILTVNGEIYNHIELRKKLKKDYHFRTKSDCEVILALYSEKGVDFINDLNGIFAFALYDKLNDTYLIARDHMGVVPLYKGWDKHGNFYVASELKSLEGVCTRIEVFPPGNYLYSKDGSEREWYKPQWTTYDAVKNNKSDIAELRKALEESVHRQLMSDVPYGVLLSGGLDSSIVSAIAKKFSAMRIESQDQNEAWWPRLHSFAVGLKEIGRAHV